MLLVTRCGFDGILLAGRVATENYSKGTENADIFIFTKAPAFAGFAWGNRPRESSSSCRRPLGRIISQGSFRRYHRHAGEANAAAQIVLSAIGAAVS